MCNYICLKKLNDVGFYKDRFRKIYFANIFIQTCKIVI